MLECARPGVASSGISYVERHAISCILEVVTYYYLRGGHAAAVLLVSVGRNALELWPRAGVPKSPRATVRKDNAVAGIAVCSRKGPHPPGLRGDL